MVESLFEGSHSVMGLCELLCTRRYCTLLLQPRRSCRTSRNLRKVLDRCCSLKFSCESVMVVPSLLSVPVTCCQLRSMNFPLAAGFSFACMYEERELRPVDIEFTVSTAKCYLQRYGCRMSDIQYLVARQWRRTKFRFYAVMTSLWAFLLFPSWAA